MLDLVDVQSMQSMQQWMPNDCSNNPVANVISLKLRIWMITFKTEFSSTERLQLRITAHASALHASR